MRSQPDDIESRLAAAWLGGRIAEACSILIDEVQSRCVKSISFKFFKLSTEDCEDCFEAGVEKLLRHSDNTAQIRNPYDYVWTCATNEAIDMLKERAHLFPLNTEWYEPEEDDIYGGCYQDDPALCPNSWQLGSSVVIAEVVLDAEVVDSSSDETIKEILLLAIGRLTLLRRRLVSVLLEHGADISNQLLAELMGMSEGATRSLKCRAFKDMRVLFTEAANELGVDINRLIAPEPEARVVGLPSLPSSEEDIDLKPPPA